MEKLLIEKPETKEKLEIKEKEPKISFEIFYTPHMTAKDYEKFEEIFDKAEVYVPESVRHTPKAIEIYNQLSQGEITPELLAWLYFIDQNSKDFKKFQLIYNSKKPILFVDLPAGHELLRESGEVENLFDQSIDFYLGGNFDLALQTARKYVKASVDYMLKREEVIKENLKEKIKELVKDNPKFSAKGGSASGGKNKKEIKVVMDLGGAHTKIYHDFKKEGVSVSQRLAYQPMVFDSLTEAERKLLFSKNKEVSDELLARGIIEDVLYRYLKDVTDNTNKIIMVGRKISSRLSMEDIAKISQRLKENSCVTTFFNCLEERDIKVPRTEEEMDEMLGIEKEEGDEKNDRH